MVIKRTHVFDARQAISKDALASQAHTQRTAYTILRSDAMPRSVKYQMKTEMCPKIVRL